MAGRSKDAADFALVLKIGQLDNRLKDKSICFTVVSGDRGFEQLKLSFAGWERKIQVLNPHHVFARRQNNNYNYGPVYPAVNGFHAEYFIRRCHYEHPGFSRRVVYSQEG